MRKFYGVGLGPGDSELITLKGLNCIKESDYIFIPKSKGKSTAEAISEEYIKNKVVIELEFPMGEDNSDRYRQASRVIDETIREGQTGAFLTLGDPLTYSTYIYLLDELKSCDIEILTIPGITSFAAATSRLNIPLTLKGDSFYLCDGELETDILKKTDSVCVLKVNKIKAEVIEKLEAENFDYAYVKKVTTDDEEILFEKDDILKSDDYMSLIIGRRR